MWLPIILGLLKWGSFQLFCLMQEPLPLSAQLEPDGKTKLPVWSAHRVISEGRAISLTSPAHRPQRPLDQPGVWAMTRGNKSEGGCKLLSCRWSTGILQSPSSILFCPAPLAKAELLSITSCGMADPAPGCTDLFETFMSEALESERHCSASLRDSPSPLSLLKSHGINFAVHIKAK